jgi:hydroxymethylbilane synthase
MAHSGTGRSADNSEGPVTAVNHGTDLRTVRLGSRTSPMAIAQSVRVQQLLTGAVPGIEVEIVGIETSGDQWHGDLAELGGKGAFLREIDHALQRGEIDIAVHCMKDVPGDAPPHPGLLFAAYLPREDVRDCVVFPAGSPYRSLSELPPGSRIGSSAVRRRAQLARHYPQLRVVPLRGNVNSRLVRLDRDGFDAAVLARTGLLRIGRADRIGQVLPLAEMAPAIGAGVIGVQCRLADPALPRHLALLDHSATRSHLTAERALLYGLAGHCNSPIAGHCRTDPDGRLSLLGMVFSPRGRQVVRSRCFGRPDEPGELGARVAGDLIRQGARALIASC